MSTTPALPATMRAVVMRAPGDVVVEDVEVPRVVHPTDVVLKIEAACVYGSDLWPYRGLQPVENRRMGHEYVGTVVEVSQGPIRWGLNYDDYIGEYERLRLGDNFLF